MYFHTAKSTSYDIAFANGKFSTEFMAWEALRKLFC